MTRQELSKLSWDFVSVTQYGRETIQEVVESTYGFRNLIHKKIDPQTGKETIWGEYIYRGKSYRTWDEFAEAVKNVKFKPKKKTDDGWFD